MAALAKPCLALLVEGLERDGAEDVRRLCELTLWQEWRGSIGAFNAMGLGVGGFLLPFQHAYDVYGRIMYHGTGKIRPVDAVGNTVTTFAGYRGWSHAGDGGPASQAALSNPTGLAVGSDGTVYVATAGKIRRIGPAGIITTYAGTGYTGTPTGDDGPALQATINPHSLALAPDGSLFFSEPGYHQVRKVDPNGIIRRVAGIGAAGRSGDNRPALDARLYRPMGLALYRGTLYIADSANNRIRAVRPDGIIYRYAGRRDNNVVIPPEVAEPCYDITEWTGTKWQGRIGCDNQECGFTTQCSHACPIGTPRTEAWETCANKFDLNGNSDTRSCVSGMCEAFDEVVQGYFGDGKAARRAMFYAPTALAVSPGGDLYVSDWNNARIRRIGSGGTISTVVGTGVRGYNGNGGKGDQTQVAEVNALAVDAAGNLFFADSGNHRVRKIGADEFVRPVLGTGQPGHTGDGGVALQATIYAPSALAFAPDGSLYIAEPTYSNDIRRVAPSLPGMVLTDLAIASEDGSLIYIFDDRGRHLRTLDGLTRAVVLELKHATRIVYPRVAGRNLKPVSFTDFVGVADGDGNVISIQRDRDTGLLTGFVDPFGQASGIRLSSEGCIAQVTNPAGETTSYTYRAGCLLTSVTLPGGQVYVYEYDDKGRLVRQSDPENGYAALSRAEGNNGDWQVSLQTAEGRTVTYDTTILLTGGMRRAITGPSGLTTVTETSADGTRTTTGPDGSRATLRPGPDPRFGMAAPLPRELTVSTPGGLVYRQSMTRSVTMASPDDKLNVKTQVDSADVNGRVFTRTFDSVNSAVTMRTPLGRQTVTKLDGRGRPVSMQVPGLLPVELAYDARGRLAMMKQGARSESYTYDERGHLAARTDSLSRTLGYESDAAGRLVSQVLPDGRLIGYTYDVNGNMTSVTPPGRPSHSFTYDRAGQPLSYVPPDLSAGPVSTQYQYNLDGQVVAVTRPDGTVLDFQYDLGGRLDRVGVPGGQIGLAYDSVGRIASTTAPGGQAILLSHDGSLVKDTTWTGVIEGNVNYTYDNDLRPVAESVDGGDAVDFRYDQDGLLLGVGRLQLTRSGQNGVVTGSTLGGVTDSFVYSDLGEVSSYKATYGGATPYSVVYSRDAQGRITQKTETVLGEAHVHGYTYDLDGRLTEVTRDGAVVSTYGYDSNGNRIAYSGSGGSLTGVYDDQDRMLQYGSALFNYTGNGEIRTRTDETGTTTYAYDAFGNLAAVALPDGTHVEYILDAAHRRVGRKVNGALVAGYLYSGSLRPVAELDGDHNVVSRFVYARGVNVPDYMVRDGAEYRIVTDHLGSPRLVVNTATGDVAQRLEYDEFGRVLVDTNPGFQPFGFAGGLYDQATGLTHFGAREYDSHVGRWTSSDPILFAGGDSNLFAYVWNDPVNFVDPIGLFGWDNVSDFTAGFGDVVSFGLTKKLRQALDVDDVVDPCSGWYSAGEFGGQFTRDYLIGATVAGIGGKLLARARSAAGGASSFGARSLGAAAAPKPASALKKLSDSFLKQKGFDAHTLKGDLAGRASRFDIFMDRTGNLFAKGKGLADETAEWLGHIDDNL
ncbi:MAG: hypothetical protein HY698_13020 [Deltaproteobacteria bacterium]|nr:hypothetical protein [Deltaproteobacteria bacterium]